MAFTGLTLPDIKESDLNSEKERRQILEYLYQLTEQLRFVLTNIGEENLTEELSAKIDNNEAISALAGSIKDAYGNIASLSRTAEALTSSLSDAEGDISTLQQTAQTFAVELSNAEGDISTLQQTVGGLTLAVSNGTSSSVIKLMAGSIELASKTIQFTGDIIFASDLTDGTTRISGSNILTGTISANRIDVNNLYVKYLSSASGSFTSLDAVNGLCHLGGDYIRINGVEIGYTTSGYQISVVPTYSGGYGNVGIGNNYWDQMKANRFAVASSIRYKTAIEPLTDQDLCDIDMINLVTYELKNKPGERHIGIIAEELVDIMPSLVNVDPNGTPDGIDYARLSVVAIAEIRKLRARVKALEELSA